MLSSEVLSVRLGGIYALQRLAEEYPEEYHVQVIRLFCAFARHPTKDERHVEEVKAKFDIPQVRDDVQAVMQAIGRRVSETTNLERGEKYQLRLENTYLTFVDLYEANLSGAHLGKSDLSFARLENANLRGIFALDTDFQNAKLKGAFLQSAMLSWANLSKAELANSYLVGAHLFKANLMDTDLSGANLSRVHDLTQKQLEEAKANPSNPPILDGALDPETGEQLEWKFLKDDE